MAEYSVVGGDSYESESKHKALTIEQLIDIGNKHKKLPVKFDGSKFSPEMLGSWRGSYDSPSITYGPNAVTGEEFSRMLEGQIKVSHYGYKGGEYKYDMDDTPYISQHGRCEEHKVVGFYVKEDTLFLQTMFFPY